MRSVGIFEVKTKLSELLRLGEPIEITSHTVRKASLSHYGKQTNNLKSGYRDAATNMDTRLVGCLKILRYSSQIYADLFHTNSGLMENLGLVPRRLAIRFLS